MLILVPYSIWISRVGLVYSNTRTLLTNVALGWPICTQIKFDAAKKLRFSSVFHLAFEIWTLARGMSTLPIQAIKPWNYQHRSSAENLFVSVYSIRVCFLFCSCVFASRLLNNRIWALGNG